MDPTPGQRKVAFAVIVLALAGLGTFLLASRPLSARAPAADHRPAASSPRRLAAASPSAAFAPTSAAASPGTRRAVNIYRWLPFTQAGLAAAASRVLAFATYYATYTYTQSARSYVGRMSGLVTAQLAATLARGFATAGVAQARAQQKQSATGSGHITGLRAFGPSSLTFVVTIAQKISGSQGTTSSASSYAVTVTGAGTGWQVSDIQLASVGNA